MMRLPIPAILAALVVVAAGSVLVSVYFSSSEYMLDVSGLGVGQNKTVELAYIPHRIKLFSNITASYNVYVYADAFFVDSNGAVYYGRYVVSGAPSNSTVVITVRDARETRARIVAVRAS